MPKAPAIKLPLKPAAKAMKASVKFEKTVIGDCTIYHGDCMKVMSTFPNASIDLILTDPPYGHNNNDGDLISIVEKVMTRSKTHDYGRKDTLERDGRPIANDGKEADDLYRNLLNEATRILTKDGGCCCCCCGGGGPDPQFAKWTMWMDEVLTFKQMVIWDKGPLGLGWHYHRSYETVLVAHRGTKGKWYDTTKRVENIIRPLRYGVRKIIPRHDEHPTEKPVMLAEFFIENHSKPGETILDPFMGRGWAGVAAVRTGRKFIGIELDPHWYKEACKRLKKVVEVGVVPKHERGNAF